MTQANDCPFCDRKENHRHEFVDILSPEHRAEREHLEEGARILLADATDTFLGANEERAERVAATSRWVEAEHARLAGKKITFMPYPKWIPCSERLPNPETNVLIRGEFWFSVEVAVLETDGEGDAVQWVVSTPSDDDTVYFLNDITHWMPIPPPPVERIPADK